MDWAPAVLAFAISGFFTVLELVTSKYPYTFFLLRKSALLYFYGAIYGLLAAGAYLLLPVISDQVKLTGIAVGNPWVRAVAVGFTIKAFLHVRLFDVNMGPGRSFPLGVESLVQVFEPWLLRKI